MLEVLKQMVEALKSATVDCSNFHHAKKDQNHNLGECPLVIRWHHAIEVGKQAIKELESQEPVAWCIWLCGGIVGFFDKQDEAIEEFKRRNQEYPDESRKLVPLYTHPPQRMMCRSYDPDEAVAKTEAKLKERNS